MILALTIVGVVVALAAGLLDVVLGLLGRKPDDFSLGALALVELVLVVQVVTAMVAPFVGNPPTGNPIEFWAYLIAAVAIPVLAAFWALSEKTRWSTVVLGVAALAVGVMLWRMHVIWTVQAA
ncbi:hypothetical protein [Schumannella sp. 10F1B-5-1]|uniref:hypothetical protein n=1 Tax=Schumannella sp. 10F1B-5-1 TaxID=2590780 RepID=UPI001131E266|nr:hypothetical protein [Schumannella sp. 10F1B-5-1]TPW70736.1 hypothetical protein FJ658_11430 [Schumannella sp. 10F1B-5-1]